MSDDAAPEEAPAPSEAELAEKASTAAAALVHQIRIGNFQAANGLISGDGAAGVAALSAAGDSPLVAAACAGRAELVTRLLQAGAPADAQTVSGLSALASAAMNGHLACVTGLIQGGATVDLVGGRSQSTALLLAARAGHRACCETLLEAGADATIRDAYGASAEESAHRFEVEGRLYAHDFKQWEGQMVDRAAVIAAEPPLPPPLYPLEPMRDLERFYRSTDPTKMLWRPGQWVHQKRPAAGPVVKQERPRAFSATGYNVTPPPVPMEQSVYPAERYGYFEDVMALQGAEPAAIATTAAIGLERLSRNPQLFNDDVAQTQHGQRATIVDAAGAFEKIDVQEARLAEAFPDLPLRIGNAPTYSSGLQRSAMPTPTAAATLYPMLEPPPVESLSRLLGMPRPAAEEAAPA